MAKVVRLEGCAPGGWVAFPFLDVNHAIDVAFADHIGDRAPICVLKASVFWLDTARNAALHHAGNGEIRSSDRFSRRPDSSVNERYRDFSPVICIRDLRTQLGTRPHKSAIDEITLSY